MNYNLETETFLLPYPDDKVVLQAVHSALLAKVVVVENAYDIASFNKGFEDLCNKYRKELSEQFRAAMREFNTKLNEKYGGFNNRMEAKHGLDRFPVKLREVIHSRAWEAGHSSGESEIDNCYYGIVEFVDSVLAAIKE